SSGQHSVHFIQRELHGRSPLEESLLRAVQPQRRKATLGECDPQCQLRRLGDSPDGYWWLLQHWIGLRRRLHLCVVCRTSGCWRRRATLSLRGPTEVMGSLWCECNL